MKKIINSRICQVLLFSALLGVVSSCKEFLDVDPYGDITAANFYKDVTQARMGVYGAYEQLASKDLYADKIFNYYHMDSDDCRLSGGDLGDNWRNVCVYDVTPNNGPADALYRALYKLINRANDAIYNIPRMDIWHQGGGADSPTPSADVKELRRLYAEAIVLRAVAYDDLIKLFGDVPEKYDLSGAEGDDLNYNRSRQDRNVIFDKIITDILEVIDWLPWAREVTADERITQGAARGMLARIALRAAGKQILWNTDSYDGVYEGTRDIQATKMGVTYKYTVPQLYAMAQTQCKTVIDKGVHQLNPDFRDIFYKQMNSRIDNEFYERMFEAPIYKVEDGGGYMGSYNSTYINFADGKHPYGEGKNYIHIMPNLFMQYNPADARFMVTCCPLEIGAGVDKPAEIGVIQTFRPMTRIYNGKFRRWWIETPFKSRLNTDANWCLLRYSDVLLMYAEATIAVENGGSITSDANSTSNVDAVAAVNQVRNRAFPGGLPAGITAYTTVTFKDIMFERWLEFPAENIRKWDLFRWGKMEQRLAESRKEMTDLYFYGANSAYLDYTDPSKANYTPYAPQKPVTPMNQDFIDSFGSGGQILRYAWWKAVTAMGVEPELYYPKGTETPNKPPTGSGFTAKDLIKITKQSEADSYLSDINYRNEAGKRGVARFFTNKYKDSLWPIPQKILDNSSNLKQSPFVELSDDYTP